MDTLKNVAIGIVFVALLGAMIVGSFLEIGRVDQVTGDPQQDREFCGNTPPHMLSWGEFLRCDWLRKEDERPFVLTDFSEDFSGDAVDFPTDSDDP